MNFQKVKLGRLHVVGAFRISPAIAPCQDPGCLRPGRLKKMGYFDSVDQRYRPRRRCPGAVADRYMMD